ncbi:MAG: pyruvate kinase [Candidatus Saccharibacteria bacterium]
MLAENFKRTKIVTTIGPASSSPLILEKMMLSGVNMFRLNFSHGTHEQHGKIITLARQLGKKHNRPIAILADLQGPKIRVGELPEDGLPFIKDDTVQFEYEADYAKTRIIPMQHDISPYLKVGERIFLKDGQINVEITEVAGTLVSGKVVLPGLLYSNQGMNLPDTDLGGDIMTPKDIADLEFAAANDADYVALSFVQNADDVYRMRDRLSALKSDLLIISKIETRAAVENLQEIVDATDAIMVARGDLAVETSPEAVPGIQRKLIQMSKTARKPVIVATQMLESMMQSTQPLRAEVSDVATAVMEGADAVMTSGETAMGLYPVETVRMMKRIILQTEREGLEIVAERRNDFGKQTRDNAISAAAVVLARQLPATVILAATTSGRTARNISSLRPEVPVIMATNQRRVFNQLAIVWGGKSFLLDDMTDVDEKIITMLKRAGNVRSGDHIVVASGIKPNISGGTDTVQVAIVD